MNKPFIMKFPWAWVLALVVCMVSVFLFAAPAYADTNGTELQVTDQPDQLVIQLGPAWAGVEFELKTDAGTYPQPVIVSPEGVLSMELGGSKTYTLSAMNSSTSVPDPDTAAVAPSQNESPPSTGDGQQPLESTGNPEQSSNSQQEDNAEQTNNPNATDNPDGTNQPEGEDNNNLIPGIPNMHLFLFAGGLIACVAGLVIMWVLKRRRNNQYDDADDFDDDDYE